MVHRLIWQWIHFLPGTGTNVVRVSMPSRAWVVTDKYHYEINFLPVSMPSRAWVVTYHVCKLSGELAVSMPSWAWVVTLSASQKNIVLEVSMPSRAWVVTARMPNILNFLCIPAIYKCILAYLSIFFNQLSEFLRCESPSTFLGTCLSHHSFIWW